MSFQPRLYDEMWWVTKIEGSLEIRLFSVGQNKAKCEEECNALQALYESPDPMAFLSYFRGGNDV